MTTKHCFDVPARLSEDICSMIANGVKGLKKKDRFAVTMVAILNAINSSPDLPNTVRKGLRGALTDPDSHPEEMRNDLRERQEALAERIKNGLEAVETDGDFAAITQFTQDLALDVLWLITCRLKQEGYDLGGPVEQIIGYTLTQTLLLVDDEEDQFGPFAEAMLESLKAAKQGHLKKAA